MRLVLSSSTLLRRLDDFGKLQDKQIASWKQEAVETKGENIKSAKAKIANLEKEQEHLQNPASDLSGPSLSSQIPKVEPTGPNSMSQTDPSPSSQISGVDPTGICPVQIPRVDPIGQSPSQIPEDDPNEMSPPQISGVDPTGTCPQLQVGPTFVSPTSPVCFMGNSVRNAQTVKKDLDIARTILTDLHNDDPGENFVVDNIDIRQNVCNMTEANQNMDYHWVNGNIVVNRVSGNHLPDDGPIKDILDVESSEILPSAQDHMAYAKLLKVHIQRILVKRIPCLEYLRDYVVQHIPHIHKNEMQKETKKVSS